ncbi:MAG: hypothetical protein ACRD0U_19890 [Acidimicrobiales bacterium]
MRICADVPAPLGEEFTAALAWVRATLDPSLSCDQAVAGALDDWVGQLRAEWLADRPIPALTRAVVRRIHTGGTRP